MATTTWTQDPSPQERTEYIVGALTEAFSSLMQADPAAFRLKFRKMAADPFAFYRGTANLFLHDVSRADDRWLDDRTSRVWIHGDLHAENFGTYMDSSGWLVFDVNDFDEAYVGPFTWDLRRLSASVALLGWVKAFSDSTICDLLGGLVRAYVDQVEWFVRSQHDHTWALRLDTAKGAVLDALHDARLSSRLRMLDSMTVVEGVERHFRDASGVRRLDDDERGRVEEAFRAYVETIPEAKRLDARAYHVKDAVGRSGFGIGSAGLPAYQVLVDGHTQALENDVVLSVKQGNEASLSRFVDDERFRGAFQHHGHRTAVSQFALQAHADRWLGWTEVDGTGYVVRELSPYDRDLDWSDLAEPGEISVALDQLGRATAKVHCVSDEDSEESMLHFQVEDAVHDVVAGHEEEFVRDIVDWGVRYAERVRDDHCLFVEAFRNNAIPGVSSS